MSDSETSENEDFLSADEYVSDDDSKRISSKSEKKSVSPIYNNINSQISNSAVKELTQDWQDDQDYFEHDELVPEVIDEIDEGDSDSENATTEYRKQSEPEPLPPEIIALQKAPSLKPGLKPIMKIVKDVRPEELIGNIANQITSNAAIATNQLTSNLSKGLATFQETSFTLKDLVVKNFGAEKEPIRLYNRDAESESPVNVGSYEAQRENLEINTGGSDVEDQDVSDSKMEVPTYKFEEAMTMLEQLGVGDNESDEIEGEVKVSVEEPIQSALNEHILELSNAFARIASSEELNSKERDLEIEETKGQSDYSEIIENQLDNKFNIKDAEQKEIEELSGETVIKEFIADEIIKPIPEDEEKVDSEIKKGEEICLSNRIDSQIVEHDEEEAGWDDWGDENQEEETTLPAIDTSAMNSPDLHVEKTKQDITFEPSKKECSEEIVMESTRIKDSNIIKTDDVASEGWENWDSESEEKEDKPVEEEKGWDDWGTEEENLVKPEESKPAHPIDKESYEADGWDDWGDEEFEDGTKVDDGIPKTKNSEENAAATEWKGWDNFGQKKEGSWGLGGWGINKLLDTASAVTHGLTNVIETGLGVPDPETMARLQKEDHEKAMREGTPKDEDVENTEFGKSSTLGNLVAGVGKIVEVAKVQEIGSMVLSGGLDTLESIGKKTMEVLQEGDPGLKKKRAFLTQHGQKLSQVLREARDHAVYEDSKKGATAGSRRKQFETMFDDYQGLIHLEALEILSRQCQIRLEQIQNGLAGEKLKEMQETLKEVEELCTVDEEFDNVEFDDFRETLTEVAEPLKNELSVTKILEIHETFFDWLAKEDGKDGLATELYDETIKSIAQLTAAVTQQFHKSGELLLVKERRKTVEEADALLQLSSHMCFELRRITKQVSPLLQGCFDPELDILIINLTTESENAVAYIKQAFGLLIPLIQLGTT